MPKAKYIHCLYCNLQFLPEIYPNCEMLTVDENKLKKLPYIPKCKTLHCSANQLLELSNIPDSMKEIFCNNCNII